MVTAAEILNRAADLIDKEGWSQGEYRKPVKAGDRIVRVRRCASAAICDAAEQLGLDIDRIDEEGDNRIYYNAREKFKVHIGRACIPSWNDNKNSKEKVVAALREAAK